MGQNKNGRKTTTKRLDIERVLVRKAKIAFAKKTELFRRGLDLETIAFRDMMDSAVERYAAQIVRKVQSAGVTPIIKDDIQKRQRPVTVETWSKLDVYAKESGLSRIQIIRAALELLARSAV